MTAPLLHVDDLVVRLPGRRSPVLNGVGFDVLPGETFSLVGESGAGKTTLGRAIAGLVPVHGGRILFSGRDLAALRPKRRRRGTPELQVVFQNPYSSLDPTISVERIIAEPLIAHGAPVESARRRTRDLLDMVGLPSGAGERLPRELSGGQRQRVAIARAFAPSPRLIVCDEPVSALDPITRERILDLLAAMRDETGVSYLFISHDLRVVRRVADRVAVLRDGVIVEQGPAHDVLLAPQHPYTRALVEAAPVADPVVQRERRRRRAEAALR